MGVLIKARCWIDNHNVHLLGLYVTRYSQGELYIIDKKRRRRKKIGRNEDYVSSDPEMRSSVIYYHSVIHVL